MGDTFDLKGKIIGLKPIPAGTRVEILVPGVGGFASYPPTRFDPATGEYEFWKVSLDTAERASDNDAVFVRVEVSAKQPPNEVFSVGVTLGECRRSATVLVQDLDASQLAPVAATHYSDPPPDGSGPDVDNGNGSGRDLVILPDLSAPTESAPATFDFSGPFLWLLPDVAAPPTLLAVPVATSAGQPCGCGRS